jgi:hypothetical protein
MKKIKNKEKEEEAFSTFNLSRWVWSVSSRVTRFIYLFIFFSLNL